MIYCFNSEKAWNFLCLMFSLRQFAKFSSVCLKYIFYTVYLDLDCCFNILKAAKI